MFVAEQRPRLWHPFRWDSTIVYSEQGTKAVFPLTSRCDLDKKKRAGREDAFMLPEGTVERLRGRAQWHFECWICAPFRQRCSRCGLTLRKRVTVRKPPSSRLLPISVQLAFARQGAKEQGKSDDDWRRSPEAQETPSFSALPVWPRFQRWNWSPCGCKAAQNCRHSPRGRGSCSGQSDSPFHGLPVVMTASGRDRPAIAV
jgi:hypothetical protein